MAIVKIDPGYFKKCFPGKGFLVSHDLLNSELFRLPQLVSLSQYLPASSVEHNLGDLDVSQDPDKTKNNNLSIEETIQQIEVCQTWMVLKNVEQHSGYREILEKCLLDVNVFSQSVVGDMLKMEAFIFISSPGSVTPFHFDPEHNFLLQIRGNKNISLFDRADRELVPEIWIEEKYGGGLHRNMKFREEDQKKASEFILEPGDGLFVPQNSPHWVKNGDEVSISFSITFRSRNSERISRLYHLNGWLRKHGIKPGEVMASPFRDLVKDTVYRMLRKLRKMIFR